MAAKALIIAAAALTAVGTGVAAYIAIQQSELQEEAIENEMKMQEIQGLQEQANRMNEYRQTIGAIEAEAVGTGRTVLGTGADSLGAIKRDEGQKLNRDIRNIKLFGSVQKRNSELSIESEKLGRIGTAVSAGTKIAATAIGAQQDIAALGNPSGGGYTPPPAGQRTQRTR